MRILTILSFVLLYFGFSGQSQAAWYMTCPGNPPMTIQCNGCDCVCNDPANPGQQIVLNVGNAIDCPAGYRPVMEALPNGQKYSYCYPSGAPVIDCNGDSTMPRSDLSFLPSPPPGYVPSPKPDLAEGYWNSVLNQLVPGAGPLAEKNISGAFANQGIDDPSKDEFFNSSLLKKGRCASPMIHPCFEMWKSILDNCQSVPTGDVTSSVSTFEYCTNDFKAVLECLNNLDPNGVGGPRDIELVRQYYDPTYIAANPGLYLQLAADAANKQSNDPNKCIYDTSWFPFEGAFDGMQF